MGVTVTTKYDTAHQDGSGHAYSARYEVISTNAITAHAALTATGIPTYWDTHDDNSDARALVIDVTPHPDDLESQKKYLVDVEFATPTRDTLRLDPTDDLPYIHWGAHNYTVVCEMDIRGVAIKNSAEDPFDPPVQKQVSMPALTVVRNELTYNPLRAQLYRDAVNSDEVTICGLFADPRHARMAQYDGDKCLRNGTDYYRVTYVVEYWGGAELVNGTWQRDTYDVVLLDQGMYKKVGGVKTRILVANIKDGDTKQFVPCEVPQLLDGSGGVLTDPAATPRHIVHRIFKEKPFRPLSLPTSE